MLICIKVPGEPDKVTAQEKGVKIERNRRGFAYPSFYEKPEVTAAKDRYYLYMKRFVPDKPIEGPVEVKIRWDFGRKSKPKRYIGQLKATKSDLDNLAKMALDCLTDLKFWKDDGQVARLNLEKRWVEDKDAAVYILINTKPEEDLGGII